MTGFDRFAFSGVRDFRESSPLHLPVEMGDGRSLDRNVFASTSGCDIAPPAFGVPHGVAGAQLPGHSARSDALRHVPRNCQREYRKRNLLPTHSTSRVPPFLAKTSRATHKTRSSNLT